MSQTILTIIGVASFTLILSLISLKQKNSSWKGVLVDKKHDYDDDRMVDSYTLIFKLENGGKTKSSVTEQAYNDSQIGERYEKLRGALFPTKIN